MAIDQNAYGQLNALATGGPGAMNDYLTQQAQSQSYRQNALDAMAKSGVTDPTSMATFNQYAPNVNTGGLSQSGLQGAYNQFLSQGAQKLAETNYEAQQKLALQQQQLNQPTAADRAQMLQGAVDQWGQNQQQAQQAQAQQGQDAYTQAAANRDAIYGIEAGRSPLVQALQDAQKYADWANSPAPAGQVRVGGEQQLAAQKIAAAQNALNAYDQSARDKLTAYQKASGVNDPSQMAALNDYLGSGNTQQWYNVLHGADSVLANQQANLVDPRSVQAPMIDRGAYTKLAGMFGVNPLEANAQYGGQIDAYLKNQQAQQQLNDFQNGGTDAEKLKAQTDNEKLQLDAAANTLGLPDGAAVKQLARQSGINNIGDLSTIDQTYSPVIDQLAQQYSIGTGKNQQNGGKTDWTIDPWDAFRQDLVDSLNTTTNPDGSALDPKEKAAILGLAAARWQNQLAKGKAAL